MDKIKDVFWFLVMAALWAAGTALVKIVGSVVLAPVLVLLVIASIAILIQMHRS
jgi:hypothetical protein